MRFCRSVPVNVTIWRRRSDAAITCRNSRIHSSEGLIKGDIALIGKEAKVDYHRSRRVVELINRSLQGVPHSVISGSGGNFDDLND